jgi:hypothetical protein
MRIVPSIALIVICLAPLAAQQGDRARIPKKGDTIIVKGCLRGSSVEHAGVIRVDAEGKREDVDDVPSYTYRLQGDKKLLKELKEKHDRKIVEVKGILRSSLTGTGLGTTVGRTRITIGSDPNGPRGAEQPLPVLDAIGFEGLPISCSK